MEEEESSIPQVLVTISEVSAYGIPPLQVGASGHRSGEWRVDAKLFTGQLKVVSIGHRCEVQLLDPTPNSCELFACCPVPHGMRQACIQSSVDSSRNFVIRLEDAGTKRHAFVGLGFSTREEAYDFTEALLRHEKFVERELAATKMSSAAQSNSGAGTRSQLQQSANHEVEALYAPRQDLSLSDGKTIRVELKRPGAKKQESSSGGLSSSTATAPALFKLPPPPPSSSAVKTQPPVLQPPVLQPPQTYQAPVMQPPQSAQAPITTQPFDPFADLAQQNHTAAPAPASISPPPQPASFQFTPPDSSANGNSDWATFD